MSDVHAEQVIQVLGQHNAQLGVDLAVMTVRAHQAEATVRDQAELLEVLTAPNDAPQADQPTP